MSVAIQTRFIGPTNYRPARVVAQSMARYADERPIKVTVSYDYDGNESHHRAARLLIEKMGWFGQYHAGDTSDGFVYVKSPAGEFTFEVKKPAE